MKRLSLLCFVLLCFCIISEVKANQSEHTIICNGCSLTEKRNIAEERFYLSNATQVTIVDFKNEDVKSYSGVFVPSKDPMQPDEYRLFPATPPQDISFAADQAFNYFNNNEMIVTSNNTNFDTAFKLARYARNNPQGAHNWIVDQNWFSAYLQIPIAYFGSIFQGVPLLQAAANMQGKFVFDDGSFVVFEFPSHKQVPMVINILAAYTSDGNIIPLSQSEIGGIYVFENQEAFNTFSSALLALGVDVSSFWNSDCPTCQVVITCESSSAEAECR